MVTRLFFCTMVCLAFSGHLAAQEREVHLDSVVVFSDKGRLEGKAHTYTFDQVAISRHEGTNLGNALQSASGIYVRQYGGEGQLSSISVRGTSPNQTRVHWHGIDINSQTLGMTDFSSIPMFLFSDIVIHEGVSSALRGGGSAGGTVELQSRSSTGTGIGFVQELGSFHKRSTGIKGSYANKQLKYHVAAVNSYIKNDFDVPIRDGETYQQNNAASELTGIQGAAIFSVSNTSTIQADGWYNVHNREVQPTIGNFNNDDHLLDKNFRFFSSWNKAWVHSYTQASFAYINDKQVYNRLSETNLQRWVGQVDHEYSGWEHMRIGTGAQVEMGRPQLSSYPEPFSQWRGSGFLFLEIDPSERIRLTINNQLNAMESQKKVPLVPSLGMTMRIWEEKVLRFMWDVHVSRVFRFPTLNDLYWQLGGNVNLKPEDGLSIETGMDTHLAVHSDVSVTSKLSLYSSHITDLILWQPQPEGNVWSAENVSEVHVYGGELLLVSKLKKGQYFANGRVLVTYNRSLNVGDDASLAYKKQLPYVPVHKWVTGLDIGNDQVTFFGNVVYTGQRFTGAFNNVALPGYTLIDVGVSLRWPVGKHTFISTFQVLNLADQEYQNYELRATPGRNFTLKLNYQFNQS